MISGVILSTICSQSAAALLHDMCEPFHIRGDGQSPFLWKNGHRTRFLFVQKSACMLVDPPDKLRSMKPYPQDLRLKVLEAVDRGMPRTEVAERFGVSLPTIKRWLKRRRETGRVAAIRHTGPPARKGAALEEALPSQLPRRFNFTLEEHRKLFEKTHGFPVSTSSVSRAFKRLGVPFSELRPVLSQSSATKRWEVYEEVRFRKRFRSARLDRLT
jgi:transposase